MIAVISYTGYDLEDATCVSKMSRERGMMYGTIYKTKMVDLQDTAQSMVQCSFKKRVFLSDLGIQKRPTTRMSGSI